MRTDLVALAREKIKPASWSSDHKICYLLLLQMFEVCGRFEGNQGESVRKMLCALDQSLTINMQEIDVSNLKQKATRFINKNCGCGLAFESHSASTSIHFVGTECRRHSISYDLLNEILNGENQVGMMKMNVVLTNELVIELNEAREKNR